jgi:cob(I)alamin adenosyltransferase
LRIYTKTGDKGDTGLIGGRRVPKQSHRMEAIGGLDELNAALGLCRLYSAETVLEPHLERLQSWLFELGAEIATPQDTRFLNETISTEQVEYLERSIDEQTESLPELRNFVLPGGSPLAAHLHLSRAVCRRAERAVLRLSEESPVRDIVKMFLNRLSDWLFVCARTANALSGVKDVNWSGGNS